MYIIIRSPFLGNAEVAQLFGLSNITFVTYFRGMESLDAEASRILHERKAAGNFRKLTVADPSVIDFSSNDYLGLARSAELQTKSITSSRHNV